MKKSIAVGIVGIIIVRKQPASFGTSVEKNKVFENKKHKKHKKHKKKKNIKNIKNKTKKQMEFL